MGVVPRRFFCSTCNKEVWTDEHAHGRTAIHASLAQLSYKPSLSNLCPDCAKVLQDCRCHQKAREARRTEEGEAITAKVRSMVQCACYHHVVAYENGNADSFARCGKCCSTRDLQPGLKIPAAPDSGAIVGEGRLAITWGRLQKVVEYSLEKYPGRQFLYDKKAPGWISNGHFLVYAARGADRVFNDHPSRECSLAGTIQAWERDLGLRIYWASIMCEPRDNPVKMVAWGPTGWTDNKVHPISVVQPEYHEVLMSGQVVRREAGRDGDPKSPVIAWFSDRIISAVMPVLETPIR